MKLEHLSIATGVMHKGMTLRNFLDECVRCNVPGLPYVDARNKVVGRISIRDVYKHMAIPDHLVRVAHMLGDQTDTLDMPEMKILEILLQIMNRTRQKILMNQPGKILRCLFGLNMILFLVIRSYLKITWKGKRMGNSLQDGISGPEMWRLQNLEVKM